MASTRRSANASYSKETQDLLKTMMKESHLTNLQRRELAQSMKNTGALPGQLPTTYRPKAKRKPAAKPVPSSGSTVTGFKLRSKEEIAANGEYEREKFRGAPIPRSVDEKKDELSNMMAYGVKKIPPKKKLERPVEPPKTHYQLLFDRFEELSADMDDCEQFIEDVKGTPAGVSEIPPTKVRMAMIKMEMMGLDKRMKSMEDSGSKS